MKRQYIKTVTVRHIKNKKGFILTFFFSGQVYLISLQKVNK